MKRNKRYLSTRIFAAAVMLLLFIVLLMGCVIILTPGARAAAAVVLLIIFAAMLYLVYRFIYIPYRETKKILHLFAAGYTVQDAFKIRYPISHEFEAVMNRVQEMLGTQELINAGKRQAQYLALQNQINPHFLYNTLEGIRGEAIAANMANIAEMTEALSTFFRYTISNVENLVSLEDELRNVNNYFLIQQYRFGDRLQLKIECDSEDRQEVYKCQLPKLTLQPIVENAIIHGVEQKAGEGIVRIRIEMTAKRLLITISDNGAGMSNEQLTLLNNGLDTLSFRFDSERSDRREGIAMVNVNNRIKLLFGEEYGITIYSTQDIGTDVVITLPNHLQDMRPLSESAGDGKRANA